MPGIALAKANNLEYVMLEPASIGMAVSAGTVTLLAVWKVRRLRWAVIILLLFGVFFCTSL